MIDIHSHILPGIDDGAKDVSMSLDMLADSYNNGITTVVATPHLYLKNIEEVDLFLKKRNESYEQLLDAINSDERQFPEIKLGCELHFLCEIKDFDKLKPLCINGTNYILVEMPQGKWNLDQYDQVYYLTMHGMIPVMAHIERFWNNKKEFYNIDSLGVYYQINAESVISRRMRRNIIKLLKEGKVQFLGSDMHNTTTRRSQIIEAREIMKKKFPKGCLEYIDNCTKLLFANKRIPIETFEKEKIFDRLKK